MRFLSRPASLLRRSRESKKATPPLFAGRTGGPLNRFNIHRLLHLAGERAGMMSAYPHRFRHAFAVDFLRNGGNVLALQRIMGHESLTMVNKYLHLAQSDLQAAHEDASPVMAWLL